MSYPPNSYTHPHPHPYATASRASPRPPPSASASASQLQPSNSQRRRSTSLPYHSHAPLGPPTAPPRIPLPDVPRESLGLDDWPPRPPLALSPTSTSTSPTSPGRPQLLGPGIPAAPPITQSRSLPGTAAPEGRFPTLQEDDEEPPQRACDRDRVRRSTDSGASSELSAHSYLSGGAGSRPGSRASGRITPLPSGVMRRYSATGARSAGPTAPGTAVGAGGQGQSSRSKSRSRATSDGDGYASASAYGSPLLPSIALDPPTLEERERLRLLERERERSSSRTPGRARQMVGALIGSLNAHAYSSSNPPPALALAPSGGGAAAKAPGPPSPTKPMRTSPSLPQIPQHAPLTTPGGSEDWHASDPPTVRRKMSAPRVDTSGAVLGRDASLHRRSSVGLLGLSGRDVAIMAPGVVEESHGRARSNSKATLSGRDTPGSLTKLLPDPFPLAPSPNDGSAEHPYHIGVFGARRCGKTTFILLGLDGWPHIKRVTDVTGPEGELLYQLRSSKIPVAPTEPGQQAPVVHYRILEVDSKQVDWEMDTPAWPPWMPHVDGAFVLFDSTNRRNAYVAPAVDVIRDMNVPCVVVATKTDQPEAFPIARMDQRTRTRDVGLVGSSSDPTHKNRVAPKHCFRYLCKVVTGGELRDGRAPMLMTPISSTPVTPIMQQLPSRPPSPVKPAPATLAVAVQSDAEQIDRMATPTPTPMPPPLAPVQREEDGTPADRPAPTSPTLRARPRSQSVTMPTPQLRSSMSGSLSTNNLLDMGKDLQSAEDNEQEMQIAKKEDDADSTKTSPPTYMYTTLEALCERVFIMAISEADLTFLYHFFLTYRKFTTTRFVLREWRKFWDSLDDTKINENMRMWGKLRLAHLILDWVINFSQDFSNELSYQSLRTVHRLISEEDHTQFHGTQLRILIGKIDRSDDPDRTWASREVDSDEESVEENDRLIPRSNSQRKITPTSTPRGSNYALSPSYGSDLSAISASRSRVGVRKKPSMTPAAFERRQSSDDKQLLKDLSKVATNLERLTPVQIARELTRLELPLFLDIEPREWPRHLWTPAKERSYPDPIDCMAVHFMRVQTWVTSLILAREGQAARSSLIARFCYAAHELRRLCNFNSLRAVHVGIKDALPNAPDVLHSYINNQQIWNMFHYHDLLFSSDRNHMMYHRTLLHTPFFAIPCFEIHTSTLTRSDRNLEWHPDEQHLLHWGKFAVFGKIVDQVTKFQERTPPPLPEDPMTTKNFHTWFVKQSLMSSALMDRRRAPEHFVDKSAYEKAKEFLLQRPRLDTGINDSALTASSYSFLSS